MIELNGQDRLLRNGANRFVLFEHIRLSGHDWNVIWLLGTGERLVPF